MINSAEILKKTKIGWPTHALAFLETSHSQSVEESLLFPISSILFNELVNPLIQYAAMTEDSSERDKIFNSISFNTIFSRIGDMEKSQMIGKATKQFLLYGTPEHINNLDSFLINHKMAGGHGTFRRIHRPNLSSQKQLIAQLNDFSSEQVSIEPYIELFLNNQPAHISQWIQFIKENNIPIPRSGTEEGVHKDLADRLLCCKISSESFSIYLDTQKWDKKETGRDCTKPILEVCSIFKRTNVFDVILANHSKSFFPGIHSQEPTNSFAQKACALDSRISFLYHLVSEMNDTNDPIKSHGDVFNWVVDHLFKKDELPMFLETANQYINEIDLSTEENGIIHPSDDTMPFDTVTKKVLAALVSIFERKTLMFQFTPDSQSSSRPAL